MDLISPLFQVMELKVQVVMEAVEWARNLDPYQLFKKWKRTRKRWRAKVPLDKLQIH